MCASKVQDVSDRSFLDSLCEGLETALSTKVCATMQKMVDDTLCASLKHGIHDAVFRIPAQRELSAAATDTRRMLTQEVCPSLAEVTGDAACAALKQVVSDTVCKALTNAVSTSLDNFLRRQRDVTVNVTPEAFKVSVAEVTGDAACAALKQVVSDTVCKALKEAIEKSAAVVLDAYERQMPLSEAVSAEIERGRWAAQSRYRRDVARPPV